MAELSRFAERLLLSFAGAKEECLPFTPKGRYEGFMGFVTRDLPITEAEVVKSEWERRRQKLASQMVEIFAEVPLTEEDKEQIVYLLICGLSKEEWPLEWLEFDGRAYSFH